MNRASRLVRGLPARRRGRRAVCGVVVAWGCLGGCQATPEASGSRPPPRHAPKAVPQRVSCLIQSVDADSNGLQDTVLVLAYLFPAPSDSPFPVWADGEFRFSLRAQDGAPIADWTFPSDQVVSRRGADGIGSNHTFTLDIRTALGTDRVPSQMAAFSATFIRPDGVTISTAGTIAVRLGER